MPVNFNAMIQPQIATSMAIGSAERQKEMLSNQQMANTQQEMAMRQSKFGQEEAEYKYILSERKRNADFLAQVQTQLEANGGRFDRPTLTKMVSSGDKGFQKFAFDALQALDDKDQLDGMVEKLRINQEGGQRQPSQFGVQQGPLDASALSFGAGGGGAMMPGAGVPMRPAQGFSVGNALAPQMDAPTNALAPRRTELTREDLAPFALSTNPAANRFATLMAPSKSSAQQTSYLQILDRYNRETDPDIRAMLKQKLESNEFAMFVPPQAEGQTGSIVRGGKAGGSLRVDSVGGPKAGPKPTELDLQYKSHIDDATAKGEIPLPRDQWIFEQRKKQEQNRADIAVQKKLDIEYPKAKASTNYFETSVDKEIKLIDDLIANKTGLTQITGGFSGNIEKSYPYGSSGRKALAGINTLRASGILSGLTELKSNGGTLGQISNAENVTLGTSRTTATNRTQDVNQVIAALQQYKSDLQISKTKLRDSFNETYSYKNSKPSVDPKFPGWGQQ